ncbi:MAG: hypothetical protein V2J25_17425 [Desulfatiglans sp.]|jgi:benzoyl-CoA reductase subunit BamC|nr:(4Fe-4S)-binding protein [Thermodesulfobacteriota bacterium]MEE4354640.1 hypothetical protein [Desulfatiglans sp.]
MADHKSEEEKMAEVIKAIEVNLDECVGCRACEVACSAFHAVPRYSSTNPARSRIRVVKDELNDEYVPVRATGHLRAECAGRRVYTIHEKEYRECSFCGASCPARDYFKEPDSGIPLKCDMCETDPPLAEPLCVQVCKSNALTLKEYEQEKGLEEEEEGPEEMEAALESLVEKYGLEEVLDILTRLSMAKKE